jgi:hypothetical protein
MSNTCWTRDCLNITTKRITGKYNGILYERFTCDNCYGHEMEQFILQNHIDIKTSEVPEPQYITIYVKDYKKLISK